MSVTPLYKILEPVIQSMIGIVAVTLIVDNGGGQFTLTVDKTYYLNTDLTFIVGPDKWKIISFINNSELVVKQVGHSNPFTSISFTLPAPILLHGTIYQTDQELVKMKDNRQMFIYLYEVGMREKIYRNNQTFKDRDVTPRLFFCIQANFNDNLQVDFEREAFDPLSNMEELFLEKLAEDTCFDMDNFNYDRYRYAKFGWQDKSGALKNIFSDNLSSIELRPELIIEQCC